MLAPCNPVVPAFLAEAGHEEVHLVLVATYQNLQVLRCTVGVCLEGVSGQILSVSFGHLVCKVDCCSCFQKLVAIDLQKIGNRLATERLHQFVGAFDTFFRRSRLVHRTALSDQSLEILLGARNQRLQGTAGSTCGFTENGHIVWIATEASDILMNPLQRHLLIQKSQVL